MRDQRRRRGAADTMHRMPSKAASTPEGSAPSSAATRPVGVVAPAPTTRMRRTRREICQRGQCLMAAESPTFVVDAFVPPPAIY